MNKIRYIKGYKVTGRKIIALVLAMMIAGSVLLLPSSPTKTTRAENIDTTEESTTAAEEVSEPTTASDTEESTTAETTEPTMEATTALDGETPTMTEPDTDEPTTVEDLGMEEPTTMSEPTTAAPTTTVGIEPADAPLGLGAVLPPSDGTSSNLNEFVTSLVITDAAGNILPLDETSTFKVGNYYKFSLTFEEQTLDQFGVGLDNDSGEYVMTYTIPDQLYIPAESYGNPVYALLPDGSRAQFANGGGDVILGTYDIVKDDTTDSWIAVFHFTENIEDINTDPNGTPDWVQLNVGGIDPITGETITADQPIYFFTNPTSANMIMDFDAQFTQSGSGNEIDFGGAYSQGTWSIQPAATPSLNISKSADGQDLSAYTSQFTITVTAKDGDVGNLMLRDWCKSATNIDPETDMTIVSVTFKGVSAVPDATMTEDVDYKITYETAGDGKIYFILTFRDDLVLPQDRSIVIVTEYNIKPQIQYAIDNNMVYDGTQVDTLLNFNLWIQNNVQAFGSGTGHNGQPIQTDEIYASSNYTRNFMDKGAGSDLYGNASWTYWYVGDGSTSVNGVKVTDFLPDGLVFTDTTTIYANLKNKDSVIVATIPVQLTEGSTSFSFTVPGESDPIPGGSGTYGKIYFVTLSDPYNTNISGVWKSDGWYHNRLTLEGGGLDGSKDVGVYINRPRPANTDMTKTGKFVYDADGTPYAEWTIQYTISGALYNYPVFITDKADMNWFTNGGQTPLINFVPDKNNTTVTYTTVDDDNNPVSGTLDWGADWGEGYVIQHARPNDGYNGPSDWLFSFNTNWNTVNINGVDTSTQDILYPMTNVQWIYTNPANTDWVSLSPFKHDTVLTITYRMPLATTYLLGEGDVVTDTSVLDVLNENDVTFSKYNWQNQLWNHACGWYDDQPDVYAGWTQISKDAELVNPVLKSAQQSNFDDGNCQYIYYYVTIAPSGMSPDDTVFNDTWDEGLEYVPGTFVIKDSDANKLYGPYTQMPYGSYTAGPVNGSTDFLTLATNGSGKWFTDYLGQYITNAGVGEPTLTGNTLTLTWEQMQNFVETGLNYSNQGSKVSATTETNKLVFDPTHTYIISYSLKATLPGVHTYKNNVSYGVWTSGKTKDAGTKVISKTMTATTGNIATATIDVNAGGATLMPTSTSSNTYLTVTDVMGNSAYPDNLVYIPGSIKVYILDSSGNPVGGTIDFSNPPPAPDGFTGQWIWRFEQLDDQHLQLNVPDSTPIRIMYDALVVGAVGTYQVIINTATVEGVDSVQYANQFQVTSTSAGGLGSSSTLTVNKRDSEDSEKRPAGAVFALYMWLPTWNAAPNYYPGYTTAAAQAAAKGIPTSIIVNGQTFYYLASGTTGVDGTAVINSGWLDSKNKAVYALYEVTPPGGYETPSDTDRTNLFAFDPSVADPTGKFGSVLKRNMTYTFMVNNTPIHGGAPIVVKKEITGINETNAQFKFNLLQVNDLSGTAFDGTAHTDSITVTGAETKSFTVTGLLAGMTYYYKITEEQGTEPGWKYDASEYIAKVTVSADGSDITVAYYKNNGTDSAPNYQLSADDTQEAVFINVAASPVSAVIDVKKNITGIDGTDTVFTFNLTQVKDSKGTAWDSADGEPYEGSISITGAGENHFTIPNLTAGTYYYKITEQSGGETGWEYDASSKIVTVVVSVGGDGNLKASTNYPIMSTDTTGTVKAFTNNTPANNGFNSVYDSGTFSNSLTYKDAWPVAGTLPYNSQIRLMDANNNRYNGCCVDENVPDPFDGQNFNIILPYQGNDIVSLACALGEQWSSGLGDSSLTSSSEKVEYMNTLGMQSNINAAFRYNLATSIAQVYQWRLYDFPLPQYDTIDPKDPATWPTNNQNITNKSGVSKDYLNLIKKAASRTFPLTGTNLTAYVQATHMLEEMMAQYNQGKQTSLVMTYTANDATSGTLTFSHDGFVPHKWDSTLDSDKTYNTILKWSGTATVKVNNGTPVSNGTTGVTVRETDTITVTGISNVVFTLTDSTNYLVSGSIKGALYEYTTNPTAYQRLHIGCAKFTTLICKLTVTASTNLTFTNKYTTPPLPATYDFEFTKVDENGNPLAGAEFTLYKKTALYTYDGPTGKTAVSGNDGTVRFTDVEPGEYAFKETAAPKGYIRNYDNDYVVVVSPNGDVEIYDDLTQTNLLEGNEVKNVPLEFGFRKTDENGKTILDEHNRPYYDPNNNYLANAEFALYASEQDAENGNNPLKAVKSGTDGAVNFSLAGIMNTIDGEQMVDFFGTPVTDSYTYTFYMKETHSPEGYEPNDTIYKIVIQNNGMYTIQWKNDSVWESLDVTPNPNPNQLFMPASTALQPLYYIRNYPKSGPRLPETGGMGMLPLKTAGIIFICGAVGAIFYRKKKESLNLSKKQKKI